MWEIRARMQAEGVSDIQPYPQLESHWTIYYTSIHRPIWEHLHLVIHHGPLDARGQNGGLCYIVDMNMRSEKGEALYDIDRPQLLAPSARRHTGASRKGGSRVAHNAYP